MCNDVHFEGKATEKLRKYVTFKGCSYNMERSQGKTGFTV